VGARFDQIDVRRGDTVLIPNGEGSYGSRTAVIGGGAVHGAALLLRDRIFDVAAFSLGVEKEHLTLLEGTVSVTDSPERSLTLAQIARLAAVRKPESAGTEQGLDVTYTFSDRAETFSFGSAAALVEVDPLTGVVRILKYAIVSDVGRMINPQIVEGQIIGAMAQGVGGALLEELIYDEEGQIQTTTFMDYLLPTASELPEEVSLEVLEEYPSKTNPLGAKGAGEGGIVPAGAVIANAVADALQPFGVQVTSLPLSHNKVRSLVREAQAR
jgi:CO/xanthine dehydrogenase Mo-binding subunit